MASRECILKNLLILQNVIEVEILERTTHPEVGVIPGTVDTWLNDLVGLSDDQVTVAFSHFRRTIPSDFNRKIRPGDIIQFIERVQTGGWLAGWREYLDRAEVSGMFGSGEGQRDWSSPLVKAAAEACGGIRALAAADVSKHPFLKKQFQDAYEAALADAQTQQTLQALNCPQIGQRAEVIQISEAKARRQVREEELICPHKDPEKAIEWLKQLRRRQIGDGPLPPQHKPITEAPGPAPAPLGQAMRRVLPRIVDPADLEKFEADVNASAAESLREPVEAIAAEFDLDPAEAHQLKLYMQQSEARRRAEREGIELTTFELPEVKEA